MALWFKFSLQSELLAEMLMHWTTRHDRDQQAANREPSQTDQLSSRRGAHCPSFILVNQQTNTDHEQRLRDRYAKLSRVLFSAGMLAHRQKQASLKLWRPPLARKGSVFSTLHIR